MGFLKTSTGRRDPLKDYWWMIVVCIGLIIGWLSMAAPPGIGSQSVRIADGDEAVTEQSLTSLDAVENPQGAQGTALGMPGSGGGGSRSEAVVTSSLYRSPGGAAGAPILDAASSSSKTGAAGSDNFAKAMRQVASKVKAPDHGWGGKSARSGFSRPKAKFGKIGSTRGSGGASTSAKFQTVKKAFGLGGETGLSGLSANPKLSPDSRLKRAAGPGNRSLEGLKKAQQASLDSLKGADEAMARGGRRTFDASAGRKSAIGQLAAAGGGGAGVSGDDGVPQNLKASDPAQLSKKEFEVPDVGEGEEKQNEQSMQEKMMMMMFSAVIGGILGPTAGGMATMLMKSEMANR